MDRHATTVRATPSCRLRASPAIGKCWKRRASTTSSMNSPRLPRTGVVLLVLPVIAACMQRSAPPPASPPVAAAPAASTTGCLASGDGQLTASLGGALKADLHWSNAQMECEGSLRPDGKVLRVAIAGPLQMQLLDDPEVARV